jgi:hypothetical protein
LLEAEKIPAHLLACEYHQPWEVENTIDEIQVHLLGRKTHIRSQRPKEVVQEIYGLLLGPKSCRVINFSLQQAAQVFHHCVFILLEHYELFVAHGAKISAVTTTGTSLFLSWLTWEILDKIIPERVSEKQPKSREKTCLQISIETSYIMSARLTIISRSGRVFEMVNYWQVLLAHGPLQKSRSLDRT